MQLVEYGKHAALEDGRNQVMPFLLNYGKYFENGSPLEAFKGWWSWLIYTPVAG